jgi:hypothetical protein
MNVLLLLLLTLPFPAKDPRTRYHKQMRWEEADMKSAHTIPHAKPPILSHSRLVRSSSVRDSRDLRDWRTGMRVGRGGATVRLS